LTDGRTSTHLWGEQYVRKLSDVLAVQEQIARQISEKLRAKLRRTDAERVTKHYTDNSQAYQLYLKGRYYSNKYTGEGFKKGIEYLQQAIDVDPAYALAYAGLAACYYDASGIYLAPADAMPKTKAAAETALKLDPSLAEAHTYVALVKAQYEREWAEAETEYR